MNGRPLAAAEGLAIRSRRGVDGSEVRRVGQKEAPVRIATSKTVADAAAAAALAAEYRAEIGEIVDVIDADNVTHSDCLIVDVRPSISAVINPTSNTAHTRRVTAFWTIRKRVTS